MDLDSAFIFSFKSSYVQLKGLNPLFLCSSPRVTQLTERCPTPPQLPTGSPDAPIATITPSPSAATPHLHAHIVSSSSHASIYGKPSSLHSL